MRNRQESPWQNPPQSEQRAPVPRLLLKPVEAADSLGISLRTLMALANDGGIPVTRIGTRNLRFSTAALTEWIDSKTSRAADEAACIDGGCNA